MKLWVAPQYICAKCLNQVYIKNWNSTNIIYKHGDINMNGTSCEDDNKEYTESIKVVVNDEN